MADMNSIQKSPKFPDCFRISPEFQLLAACSWVAPEQLDQARMEKIAALCNGGMDWNRFVSLVRRHGIPSLAYSAISRNSGIKVPSKICEALQKFNNDGRRQALFQTAELVHLIKLFAAQGIELVPLKGVFLSHQLYGDQGMRNSGDLDFMVQLEHIDRAEHILIANGYNGYFYGFELTARRKKYIRTHIHHFEYVHIKTGLHVELHWNVGSWLPDRVAALWSHTRQQEWYGTIVTCLDDDALLLYLCDHGTRHEWSCLKWLSDVARLLATDRTNNWNSLLALAKRLDLLRVLAHSALLVHWIYSVPLPPEFARLISQEKLAVVMSEKVLASIFTSDAGMELVSSRELRRLRPSMPYVMYLKSSLITHADWQFILLPDSLFWLYCPLRPLLYFWRLYCNR